MENSGLHMYIIPGFLFYLISKIKNYMNYI